jgi:beta-barrel assembly-enhancing protease
MFINTGLLKAVDNEAQLAGVMGHEMSHVILRHSTNQASKSKLIELPAVLGSQVAAVPWLAS